MLLGITWLCVVCVALLSGYMLVWSRLRRPRALLAHLPSDPQLPLLGNLLQVIGDGRNFFRLLDRVSHLADRMRKPALIWLGPVPNILILDPEDVKTVSHAFIEKTQLLQFCENVAWRWYTFSTRKMWKHNVKNVKNSFKANMVEGFQGIFNEQARRLIDSLTKVEGKLADIMPILKLTALEAICQAVFGPVQISESFVSKEHFEAFNRCLELMLQRGLTLWLHPDCIYRHTGGFKNFEKSATVLRNVTQMVAAKKSFQRMKTKKGVSDTSDSGNEKKFKYLLDVLLDLKESDRSLTEEQINHEVDTIILGGQQTTASTVLFTLLMLGSRPAVQEKLYHEMKSIFGDSSRPVETADLQKMTYCDAVLNETLRLFPPFPTVMRHADTDLQLKSCLIPEGITCIISIWGAGRSVHTWGPDALEFDPERWLDGRVADKPAAFIPFSYGQRACIGKKYGIAITKTILAWCVRELQFSSQADQLDFKIDIALRPISGHLLQIKRRNKMS